MSRPYFKKTENFQAPDKAYRDRHQVFFHQEDCGTDGPLHSIFSSDYSAHTQYWHATCRNLGVETNRNYHSGSNVGCWTAPTAVNPQTQERWYSAPAYYLPASHRKNLVLLTKATVRDFALEQDDGKKWRTKGVRFMHGGQEYEVCVKGEVIICAGSGQSPQLLELSGIGNPEILKSAGIETKVANPNVGENLQDHMGRISS